MPNTAYSASDPVMSLLRNGQDYGGFSEKELVRARVYHCYASGAELADLVSTEYDCGEAVAAAEFIEKVLAGEDVHRYRNLRTAGNPAGQRALDRLWRLRCQK